MEDVTFPVRVLKLLGVETIICEFYSFIWIGFAIFFLFFSSLFFLTSIK